MATNGRRKATSKKFEMKKKNKKKKGRPQNSWMQELTTGRTTWNGSTGNNGEEDNKTLGT